MEYGEILNELQILLDRVGTDIDHEAYDNMRAGIRTALGFVRTQLTQGVINGPQYDSLVRYCHSTVIVMLTTE
jgi:hypothetical protein